MFRRPPWYALAIMSLIALANGVLVDDGSVAEVVSVVGGGALAFAAGATFRHK